MLSLLFLDLLFEVLSLAWSLEEELPVPLEDVLGVDEELDELAGLLEPDLPPFIEDEPLVVPEVDAAPLYCDEELVDDGLCVLPLL